MIHIDNFPNSTIEIGRQGENLATEIEIDVSPLLDEYPDGYVTLWALRSGDIHPYAADAEMSGNVLLWHIHNFDTEIEGNVAFEIRITVGDILKKSIKGHAHVENALSNDGASVPSGESWADRVIEAAEFKKTEIKADVMAALESTISNADSAATNANNAATELRNAAERGDFNGKDGYTPVKGKDYFDGTDATVTAAAIHTALGFTPANPADIPNVPNWAKQPEKPTYTAAEVGAMPAGTKIPAKLSDLDNDIGAGSVTTENIEAALGYKPADNSDMSQVYESITDIRNTKADKTEIPSVPVKSVSAGGTAITPDADGNVDVPIATATINGLVKADATYGVGINQIGLYLINAGQSAIEKRVSNKALTLNALDEGVKAALTDGKGAAYTAEEQAAARERIGAERNTDMRLIGEIDVTKDVPIVSFDISGFDVTEFHVEGYFMQTSATSHAYIQVFNQSLNAYKTLCSFLSATNTTYASKLCATIIKNSFMSFDGNGEPAYGYSWSGYSSVAENHVRGDSVRGGYVFIEPQKFEKLRVYLTSASITVGSKFRLYAR